jgi:hypothetical protein
MNERLLLRLPHRQMVFTFPKVLRGFFCHHRTLYGKFARFNPHLHAIVLEGGFDPTGRFAHIPAGSSRTREALSQYIARAPVSLNKLLVEDHAATVLFHTAYNPYFRTNLKVFRATDFMAELL